MGIVGYFNVRGTQRAMLPEASGPLLLAAVVEIAFFALIFALAWVASRARASQLLLRWRGHVRPALLGMVYSVALRLLIAIATVVIAVLAWIAGVKQAALMQALRPQVEHIVSTDALASDPLYLALMLTLISFVLAGLREELWRAGMFAAFRALFPGAFSTTARWLGVSALVALVFGIGHLTQGVGGVVMTTMLGFGLGSILLYHRSIWEAVLAHGFFNATSFILLYALRDRPDLLGAPIG